MMLMLQQYGYFTSKTSLCGNDEIITKMNYNHWPIIESEKSDKNFKKQRKEKPNFGGKLTHES